MNRVIVDYKKLTQNILDLLVEKYPDGYSDSDIISFRNAHNELIEAVEVKTDDTTYLVKVSVKLAERMDDESDDDDDDDDDDGDDEIIPKEIDFKEEENNLEDEDDDDEDEDDDEEEDNDDLDK